MNFQTIRKDDLDRPVPATRPESKPPTLTCAQANLARPRPRPSPTAETLAASSRPLVREPRGDDRLDRGPTCCLPARGQAPAHLFKTGIAAPTAGRTGRRQIERESKYRATAPPDEAQLDQPRRRLAAIDQCIEAAFAAQIPRGGAAGRRWPRTNLAANTPILVARPRMASRATASAAFGQFVNVGTQSDPPSFRCLTSGRSRTSRKRQMTHHPCPATRPGFPVDAFPDLKAHWPRDSLVARNRDHLPLLPPRQCQPELHQSVPALSREDRTRQTTLYAFGGW